MPLAAEAQQAAKAARIGYLASDRAAGAHLIEAFRQGLRDLGYVEGHNVVIEYRDAEGKYERLPALAAELVALKVDVIVAGGTPQALAAKQATRTIPIVLTGAGDPVTSGLVTSLARPGGNVTGLSVLRPDLVGKCLELLKQAIPGVSHVAVLWHPGGHGERTEENMLKEAEVAGRALGVGREARRSARRAAHKIRTGHQPQDREGPWPHDPAFGTNSGGRDHPVIDFTVSELCQNYRPPSGTNGHND